MTDVGEYPSKKSRVLKGVSVTVARKAVVVLYLPCLPVSSSITRRPAVTGGGSRTLSASVPAAAFRMMSLACLSSE